MWTIVKVLFALLVCGASYTYCTGQSQTINLPSNIEDDVRESIEKLRDNIQSSKSGNFLIDTTRVSSPIYATLSSRELDSGTGGEGGTPLFSLAFSVKKKVTLIVARFKSSVNSFVASGRNHYDNLSRKINSKKSYIVTLSNLAESLGYSVKKKEHEKILILASSLSPRNLSRKLSRKIDTVKKEMSLIGTSRNDIWHSPAVLDVTSAFDIGVYRRLTGFG